MKKMFNLKNRLTNPRGWQLLIQPTPGVGKVLGKRVSRYLESALLFLGVFLPSLALAQAQIIPTSYPGQPKVPATPATIVTLIFHIAIAIGGAIFLLMILFGGIQYLTSAGNEDGVDKAKKTMLNAGIGLVIILAAYAIGTFILKAVGFSL